MSRKDTLATIRQQIPENEEYHGAFSGTAQPAFAWHFLLGNFAPLLTKTYIIYITDKKLYFSKLNLLGHLEVVDGFTDFEIRQLHIKKNLLAGYTFTFEFNNGRKLKLKVFTHQRVKSECQLTPELMNSLKERFKCC